MSYVKVVFRKETFQKVFSPSSGGYEDTYYDGEESYEIGDHFKTLHIEGKVCYIHRDPNFGGANVWIATEDGEEKIALWISDNSVRRLYYGAAS